MNQINGSGPDQDHGPDMSPSERKVWAASHNLPPRYLLVTSQEMQLMGTSMAQQRSLAGALQRTFKECEVLLADYWRNEPDLPNGVASAVFDATRYKKAVTDSLPELRNLVGVLEAAVPLVDSVPAREAIHDTAKSLAALISTLNKVTEQRRSRRGKS